MIPNCISISGRQSTLAPPSIRIRWPFAVGRIGARAGRFIPLSLFAINVEPTTSAPVLPAETKASPLPSARACKPTAMEQSFLLLIISVGSSWISITDSVCIMDILSRLRLFFSAVSLIIFSFPVRVTSTPSSATALAAPSITAKGALSPPNASTIIFILPFPFICVCIFLFLN